jgi:histidinol-phosphate aminotransferase
VAYAFPTYSLYDTLAAIQEAAAIHVPFGRDFVLPMAKLAAARARVTIVCNPNSPSGTFTPVTTLASLALMVQPRLLVIDEAYVDFAASTALQLVKSHPNLVVLRTLSKSFSLAGMRLGLAFASEPAIENLLKVKDSYNLSRVAVAAGVAALRDIRWMRRNVARVIRTRELAEKHLRKLGFEVPRSSANFVLARLAGRDLARLASALRRKGVLVRHFDTPMLRDAIRISIGTPSEMSVLFKYLTVLVPRLSGRNGPSRS